ncbi:MAG: Lrp/AsnC family transcriptional regulator [Nitratireductor sp.]|nr:Lrp/AsnC family transcriptional regulator [Nitratireductor sp.]MCB1457809.1 Lrp/AsnC family transcriptional regulator [Nitratireductor sp.]
MNIDAKDRSILSATQGGLPLVPGPFAEIARWLKMDEADVMRRISAMQDAGVIRRIAVAPNHYALGMVANGMSVWDVDDANVDWLGPLVGNLEFVTHCYVRPRALPDWPYNLFAMIHGSDRDSVEAHRKEISQLLGNACRANDILYSTRILKKTGMRLSKES